MFLTSAAFSGSAARIDRTKTFVFFCKYIVCNNNTKVDICRKIIHVYLLQIASNGCKYFQKVSKWILDNLHFH